MGHGGEAGLGVQPRQKAVARRQDDPQLHAELILATDDKVLDDPEPNVRVHELADSSVNLITRPWVKTDDYWDVFWDVTETVKRRFDEEGIQIPFPQRDVHFYNEGAPAPSLKSSESA